MRSTALEALSLGGDDPNWWQAVIRGLLVYLVALLLLRVGEKRALGKNTAMAGGPSRGTSPGKEKAAAEPRMKRVSAAV